MDEFEPQKKEKIFTKSFISRYLYIFILGIVVLFGSSYSLTFFVQNKKIATGSLKTAALTIDFTDRNINAISLSIPTSDKEGLKEFVKNLVIENTAQVDGKVKVTLDRTSGLNLTDMKYSLSINGTIIKIDDMPSDGVILETAIFSQETINVEVRLWPKTTYTGTETTFKGTLIPEIRYLGTVASSYDNLANKYVNFNCTGSTCEKWVIVKVENNRLVLTREADLSGATARTDSGRFDSSQNFNDSNNLVTSLSTDNKNIYLAKTVKIKDGEGTQDSPYNLINNNYSNQDEKVIAIITYDNDEETATQPVYYNKINYISQEVDDSGFQGWTDNTNDYVLGDAVSFTTDTTLYSVIRRSATFDIGQNVNAKIKTMVNNVNNNSSFSDVTLEKILWSDTLPNNFTETTANTVSSSTSEAKIYAWYDSNAKTVYLYTPATDIYLNNDSSYLLYNFTKVDDVSFISDVDTSSVTNMYYMFNGCSGLTSLDLSDFNTSNVKNMSYMFYNCSSLVSLPLGDNFDTSSVTNMQNMFYGCSSLTSLSLGDKFDTSIVTTMSNMFYGCSSLTSLSLGNLFDTSSVTTMYCMFNGCSSLTVLSLGDKFDTSSVTNMQNMFYKCSSLVSLSLGDNFDTSSVTTMSNMFYNCSGLTSLSLGDKYDTSSVTNMSNMFYNCSGLTSLSLGDKYDTSSVQNMQSMFYNCSGLTNLSLWDKFDTSSVTNMQQMFSGCNSLTSLSLGDKFDTSSVTNMQNMFSGCSSLSSLSLEDKFDTSIVTTMSSMFNRCSSLTSLSLENLFDTSSVTRMNSMFSGCNGLTNLSLGDKFDTSSVTTMLGMFFNCSGLTSLSLGNLFDTSSVTNMQNMFNGCSSLTSLSLGDKFDTSIVANMYSMFSGCSSLTSLSLGNLFDTSIVTNMYSMFSGCSGLTSLSLGDKFDTSSVANMQSMFSSCSNLVTIYVGSSFTLKSGLNSGNMFSSCTSLVGGNGTTFSSSNVTATYARIDGDGGPGYFTDIATLT